MNKLNPKDVASDFDAEITKLVDYYLRSAASFHGSTTEKSDTSLLAEHVFLSAAISFEGALSDLFFAYTNKDASVFIAKKQSLIQDVVKREFGDWYAKKVVLGSIKHIKAGELYPLLDPTGHNITFYDAKKMVERADKYLIQAHAAKYKALSTSHHKLMNAAKFIRNCIAHRSDASYEAMMDALVKLQSGNYKSLARTADKKVNSIGAYLKASTGPKKPTRIEVYLSELRAVINVLGA
ncbi:hypothetical protein [Methyloversatilis sp. MC4-4]|uniref:hypothetical protein n=1 Tax=Methyloversatilis sp. MC4-4 TaxID=3132824 RepID=UPI003CE89403